jgi:hypothetical protein
VCSSALFSFLSGDSACAIMRILELLIVGFVVVSSGEKEVTSSLASQKAPDGLLLVKEMYDLMQPGCDTDKLKAFFEKTLSDDFTIGTGPINASKELFIPARIRFYKGFPDAKFEVQGVPEVLDDGSVVATIVVSGDNTGIPWAPFPKLPELGPTGNHCVNDPDKITHSFTANGQFSKMAVEFVNGSRGFHGPPGFYKQIGGVINPTHIAV